MRQLAKMKFSGVLSLLQKGRKCTEIQTFCCKPLLHNFCFETNYVGLSGFVSKQLFDVYAISVFNKQMFSTKTYEVNYSSELFQVRLTKFEKIRW